MLSHTSLIRMFLFLARLRPKISYWVLLLFCFMSALERQISCGNFVVHLCAEPGGATGFSFITDYNVRLSENRGLRRYHTTWIRNITFLRPLFHSTPLLELRNSVLNVSRALVQHSRMDSVG
ncbi:hypothetical protein K469DRAFT_198549 [Zopfia rhizophila CBS 207.26]|uniref:Uncharacterized protein n=1 Tax=Zopfia rhizophila CBS 207.26 TaxID=1314779 RepID=A0A6A6DZ63_9PEZI|nr:hypothetical protein K469DRAFT_198549 [Zopfia rhizophila CBS 207.26]